MKILSLLQRRFLKHHSIVGFGIAAALGLLNATLIALPAQSAERIQFFVGPFEPTVYVDDLETFAKTGNIEPRLASFINRLDADQKASLRAFLNARYDISPIPVSQFTYSFLGEQLLQRAGQVIQTDSYLNGMKAIRASLILAAADEAGFTTINVMRQFPTDTIQLDFRLARKIAREGQQIFVERDEVVSKINQVAQAKASTQPKPLSANDPQRKGPYAWQVETITFQNSGRLESSQADVYAPISTTAEPDSIPVIVISHGVASDRRTFSYLAEHLASHGYGVVALEHTETSAEKLVRFFWGQDKAPDPIDLLLRPQDITAALDTLTDWQNSSRPPNVHQDVNQAVRNFNLKSVGLLGQSLGGYTVLAAAGAAIDWPFLSADCEMLPERPSLNLSMFVQCSLLQIPRNTPLEVADPRVAAVIALNPLASSIFGRSGIQQVEVPVMLVAGTDDYVAPALLEQIEPFSWLETTYKHLVIMERGTHFSFLDRENGSVVPFSDTFTGPNPQRARPQVQALSLAFFNQHLKKISEADMYLTQRYLNTFPTEPFKFTLVDELPE
ncbi:conserved hypothetical protein [Synechococcus sp. PCC 7335]|uniref:alpha/beta hydrolase n=1 Tax=Synechococcus sp. (strain ATCC 29403 / PCC 7335) TaxID=91464 RepID=UPI00017EB0D7|nr:alpha/beta hydrolase [Synechococcus sp. PCC 7335]EDX86003.1 conserved hypothetical protein [Synechococcus sp. PCC 7335]